MLAMNPTQAGYPVMNLCHAINSFDLDIEVDPTAIINRRGNSGIVAGVMAIIVVAAVLALGNIIVGAFAKVATNSNLGLDETWLNSLNATMNMTATAFNISSLIPFALGAGLVVGAIVYVFPGTR